MAKEIILLEEIKNIVKKHRLSFITLEDQDHFSVDNFKNFQIEEGQWTKYIVLFYKIEETSGYVPEFKHAEPIIVQKIQGNYKIVCLFPDFSEFIKPSSSKKTVSFIMPIYEKDRQRISVLGAGQGCLELSIYALEKLDPKTGIILNGKKGHNVEELKNGDPYTTEELAKLTRSEKYLITNGIDPKQLMVKNTDGKEMTLEAYREIYKDEKYNELLNLLSNASQRVLAKRTNSLEDLQKLWADSKDPSKNKKIAEIIKKRKEAN